MHRRTPLERFVFSTAFVLILAQTVAAIGFDPTFGTNGTVLTSFSATGQPSSGGSQVFIQPSGRIVIVGTHSQQGTSSRTNGIAIVGLTSAGIVDTSFGSNGKILSWSPTGHRAVINSLVQLDGSILVLYQQSEPPSASRPVLERFTAAGQPDPSFSAELDVFPGQTLPVRISPASGGKIYALVRDLNFQYFIVRLNDNGSRDTTFGPDGVRSLNLKRFSSQPRVFAFEELYDGKILVAGTYHNPFEGLTFVARFNNDITLDRSFGLQGTVRLAIPYGSVHGGTMKVQPDSKILIGGSWTFLGSTTVLFRLTTRGRLDPDFGTGGVVQNAFNNWNGISKIDVAEDRSIFVVGTCGAKSVPTNQRMLLVRYSPTGSILSSAVVPFIGGREASGADLELQPDGKLLVTGAAQNLLDNFTQLAAARFGP